jgi:hypothetical protein
MARKKAEKPKNWNVFSAQQGVDMGSPNDSYLLGTCFGTKDQVWAYAKRTWPNFTGPWGSIETGRMEPQPEIVDATRETHLATQLSKRGQKLVEDFDDAARQWGWTSDQGTGDSVYHTQLAYDAAKLDLVDYVLELEKRAAKPKP